MVNELSIGRNYWRYFLFTWNLFQYCTYPVFIVYNLYIPPLVPHTWAAPASAGWACPHERLQQVQPERVLMSCSSICRVSVSSWAAQVSAGWACPHYFMAYVWSFARAHNVVKQYAFLSVGTANRLNAIRVCTLHLPVLFTLFSRDIVHTDIKLEMKLHLTMRCLQERCWSEWKMCIVFI